MKYLLSLISILIQFLVSAQNVTAVVSQAQQLENNMNDEAAVAKYKQAVILQPSNIYALCKASELSSRIASRYKENPDRQSLFFADAKDYAAKALKVDPQNSEANFVMAMVMGREAISAGGKDKIMAVKDVKHYADLAVKYDPKNFKAWYILGKWYYEVSSLNYIERTAVKVFFGSLPNATISDAINCFERAKSISPSFVLNYLSLAKAYKKKDEEDKAKENLSVMVALPDQTQDDARLKSEGRSLLKKWN
ncbi:MAG: hypothetical protein ABIR19_03915 [Ginsengibacter sp.]